MGLFGKGRAQSGGEKRPFLDPLSLHRGRRLAAAVEEKRRLDRWAQSLPETGRIMGWFSCLPANEQESMIRACLPAVARSWIKASMRLRAWFGYLLGMLLVSPAVPIFVLYVMHGLNDQWMSETFGYWPVVCIAAALLSWKLASFADAADRAGWPVCLRRSATGSTPRCSATSLRVRHNSRRSSNRPKSFRRWTAGI